MSEARQIVELGRLFSAQYLITGNIGNRGSNRYWINMKLIETKSGEVSRSISKEYRSLTQLLDDCKKITLALIDPEGHGSGEYKLVYGPEHHQKYNFIGAGYHYTSFDLINNADLQPLAIGTHGASIWFSGIQGTRWILQWGSNFFFPFGAASGDAPIDLGIYSFPWGVDIFFGPGYMQNFGSRFKLMTALDLHYTQLTLWPTKQIEDMHRMIVYIAFGVGADLSLFYRLQEANYVRFGCAAAYDLYNALQGIPLPQGGPLKRGLTIAPYIMLGSGR